MPNIGILVHPDVPTCGLDESLNDVSRRVLEAGWNTCVVVNAERIVIGRLFKKELESGAGGSVETAMRPGPSTYRPNVDVLEMSHHLTERKLQTALVTLSNGRLLGLVRLHEILDSAATLGHGHEH